MCNEAFTIKPRGNRKRICCSPECTKLYRSVNTPTKLCKNCKIEFKVSASKKNIVFCSAECRNRYRNIDVVCLECNMPYTVTSFRYETIVNKNGIFCCSRKCANKHRPTRDGGYKRNCKNCQKQFETYTPRKYTCSEHCSKEWRNKKSKQYRIECICEHCKKKFDRRINDLAWGIKRQVKNIFCSTECSKEYRIGEKHPAWIKDRSKLKQSKDKTFRQSRAALKWRDSVFARDQYQCQECLKFGYVEAHHIIPLRIDSTLSLEVKNGITLCRNCHMKTFYKELTFAEKYKRIIEEKCVKLQK